MRSPVPQVVPQEVKDELRRVAERWRQLPLDHALSRMPQTLALVQSLADRVATFRNVGSGAVPRVPDLGPAVVMDQLTVMVWDVFATEPGADPAGVLSELRGIRAAL